MSHVLPWLMTQSPQVIMKGETDSDSSTGERPLILALDFDNTIVDDEGKIQEGAAEALQILHERGWVIVIWTLRTDHEPIREFIKRHKLPIESINESPLGGSRKIFYDLCLDDRNVEFNQNWKNALARLLERAEECGDGPCVVHEPTLDVLDNVTLKSRSGVLAQFSRMGRHVYVDNVAKSEMVLELERDGLITENGRVGKEDGESFLRALVDQFTGSYIWAESK